MQQIFGPKNTVVSKFNSSVFLWDMFVLKPQALSKLFPVETQL